MVEVDRQIAAAGVERHALQIQRAIAVVAFRLQEEQVLSLVEAQHRSAVERAGHRIFRQQQRVVHDQMRKLRDDHRHEALVVAVALRCNRMDPQRAVLLLVQWNDVGHDRDRQIGCKPCWWIFSISARFFGSCARSCRVIATLSAISLAATDCVSANSSGCTQVRNPMPYRTY
jgi:hypothetical protein